MRIVYLRIQNYKSIQDMEIRDMENALILVGKNNTGKTVVIDAIRVAAGEHVPPLREFFNPEKKIRIWLKVEFNEDDLELFHEKGIVSNYKKYDLWEKDFHAKLPSYQDGILSFECQISKEGQVRYADGVSKHNSFIKEVFPKTYHIDHTRNVDAIQNDVVHMYDNDSLRDLEENRCLFDQTKQCNQCFYCIPVINKKQPQELTIYELARLMEYRMCHMKLGTFSEKLNRYFHANGSASQQIRFVMDFDAAQMLRIEAQVEDKERKTIGDIQYLSEGLKSIYALSLLEAYIDEEDTIPCIIMMEDPEIFLHPHLQKISSEVLYRLSKKNQVIFSTHSPNMIFNFSSRQIRQVVLDKDYCTTVKEESDVDEILDDLGYTANDLMNVSFVFIVEGKQDSNRLPLLLERYYKEIYDENGNLQRISIIPTNSCTNIKTYANLKYINKLYLKDQFLMIRDSDGKNPKQLARQLCSYYAQRSHEDVDNLPRVTMDNVLILKYYSFENYFLNPAIMTKIGVVKSEEDFYNILYKKYKDYLFKLGSTRRMVKQLGIRINSKQDLKEHMEDIKIYVRGHNLFDIFYGKYRGTAQTEILKKYIEIAPPEEFDDILKGINRFVYFDARRKKKESK